MADEIKQQLGLDAKDALDTLAALDSALATYTGSLGKTVEGMKTFNKQAGKTVSALQHLATDGKAAADQLERLGGLKMPTPPKAPTTTKNALNEQDYIDKFKTMFAANEKFTASQKRSHASMISNAASFAKKNGTSFKEIEGQAKNLDQVYSGAANRMANHLGKMEKSSQNASKTWTVSWETMARVVATQAIVRALNVIRQSLKAAVGDAVKFQRAIAEIKTISGPLVGNMNSIADIVNKVSDAFNVDIADTAEAAYQTISNQVADTNAELKNFLGSAAKFAKITKTDMATSVNLLSGVLNAFGKDVSETDDVAAKFFNTIKLGRTRAEELAQGYGTVAPIADKLGISMEELNASVATLTINGIKTDKAFTQIRGTMQAFLKPTEDMKDALKELGFESGEQLLQANNLQEALRLVAGSSDGTAASIARLFPRIRGLTGVLTALDDEAGHFTKSLNEQKKALEGAYADAYELVVETDAEKITKEMNQIKNFFTVEFGQAVLEAGVRLSQTIGGAGALLDVFKAMAPLLGPLVVSLTAVATVLTLIAARAALTKAGLMSLKGPMAAVIAFYAAMAAGKFIAGRVSDSYDAELRAQLGVMAKQLAARKSKIAGEIASEKAKVETLVKLLGKSLAESRKEFFKVADASKESNIEIIADVKRSTNKIIAQRQKMVTTLQNQVNRAGDNIISSEKRAADIRTGIDDQLFNRKLKNDSNRLKVNKLTQKSAELAQAANAKLAGATTEKGRAAASAEFQRAKAFADQALSIADNADSRALEKKALSNLKDITDSLIASEKSYQKNVAASAKELENRTVKEQKRVDALKNKQKELLDAFSLVDDKGELLSPESQKKQLAKAGDLLREFVDLSGDPLDVATMLNFTGVSAQLQQSLHQLEIRNLVVSKQALNKVSADVNAAINKRREDPAFQLAEKLAGRKITPGGDETVAIEELTTKYDAAYAARQKYLEQGETVKNAQGALTAALDDTLDVVDSWAPALTRAADALGSAFSLEFEGPRISADFLATAEKALALSEKAEKTGGAGIHPDEIVRMAEQVQTAFTNLPAVQEATLSEYATKIKNDLLLAKELVNAYQGAKKLGSPAETDAAIQQLDDAINALKGPQDSAAAMATSLTTAQTAQEGMVSPSQQAATANQASATALSKMAADSGTYASNMARANAGPVAAAHGGQMGYFANGGQGTDVINAMLSRGETVTNAKSSRRFASQLQAINAGQKPVYRSEGGDTYNTNVSDINVSGAGNPQQTAREVMKAIRREERRGSGR